MLNSGREVALQLKNLLANILQLYSRPDHPATKQAVLTAAKEISKLVGQLSHCGEQLHSSSPNHEEKPLLLVENELLGAASSIEAVSNKLSQMRPRQVHKADEDMKNLPFDEQILSSSKSITLAVQTLVKAAYNAQRELISQGRMSEPSPVLTKDEQYWTEGLVSAATLVAAATNQLCEAANGVVQGHSTEEKLIAAAKQVASSTAHLLVACKVKSDIGSSAMQRLQSAGHAVKVATEHLVNAARQSITENDCRGLVISDRMVTGIAQVMDAQEEVLRKEKELTEARNRLTQLNKSRYEKSPEPSPEK
uniref:I/LWEQ domain-containing protein n=1 Tax=Meloidogyne hapla TaxID=6305 RepID=A0A1I8B0U2_MELHA